MPLTKTFWSPRFGVGWMVSVDNRSPQSFDTPCKRLRPRIFEW